jgi:hypothetical protein
MRNEITRGNDASTSSVTTIPMARRCDCCGAHRARLDERGHCPRCAEDRALGDLVAADAMRKALRAALAVAGEELSRADIEEVVREELHGPYPTIVSNVPPSAYYVRHGSKEQ